MILSEGDYMENKGQITMQIVDLYHELQKEIFRVIGDKSVAKYARALTTDKRKTLDDIRTFRNQVAFSAKQTDVPFNYQEWIDFLKAEIELLKTNCN